jgi:hypothetical protein
VIQDRPSWSGRRSSRWQAYSFGASLLIHDETAWWLPSFEDVSIQAGIDLLAAKIHMQELHSAISRPESDVRIWECETKNPNKLAGILRRKIIAKTPGGN